jgi:hypothetical protein
MESKHLPYVHGFAESFLLLMFPYHGMSDAKENKIDDGHRYQSYKCKKVRAVTTASTIIKLHPLIVLGFNVAITNPAVVVAQGVPYSTLAVVFDGYFKMDIVRSWWMKQSPTIWRWYRERIIGIISF